MRAKNLTLQVLGQTELSTELKDKPALVRDFFGREWARVFTGGGEDSSEALDATDIATTRAELQKLYLSNFGGIDPGIVAADMGRADTNRLLPIFWTVLSNPTLRLPILAVRSRGRVSRPNCLRPRRVILRRALLRVVTPRRSPGKCYAGEYRAGWRKMIIR